MTVNKSAIQKQLRMNAQDIFLLESDIQNFKHEKALADFNNELEVEFHYHNYLKRLRSKLKDYVAIQKTLKQIMKGN